MRSITKSVVLLSGGLDSTVLLADRIDSGREVLAVSFDYGQRHARELLAAERIASHYAVRHRVLPVLALSRALEGAGSSQLSQVPVPHGHYADESMRVTVVPNRNMVMLALATAYAIAQEASEVAYAAHAGDHAIYPDCRPQFATAMRQAIALCDYKERAPLLVTPFISVSKADIVQRGAASLVPFELTWSCYDPQGLLPKHCGKCGTCVERREAFVLAGVTDPTEYAS